VHLTEHVEIAASPALVWDITTYLPDWPEWTPTVTAIEPLDGAERVALGVRARLKQPAQRPAVWTVTEYSQQGESYSFAWSTKNMGATFVGRHDVAPLGNGAQCTLTVEASGFTATLLSPILKPLLAKALADEAQGLKQYAEARAGRDGSRRTAPSDESAAPTA